MEAIFDDLSRAVREPRTDMRPLVAAIALYLAGKLAGGIAIGLVRLHGKNSSNTRGVTCSLGARFPQ